MADDRELSAQQIHFATLYASGNQTATECAKQAGYSSPASQGSRLLKNAKIVGLCREHQKFQAERIGWNANKVVAKMAEVFEQSLQQGQFTPAINALSKLGSWVGLSDRTSSAHVTVDIGFEKLLERAGGAIDITPSDVLLPEATKTSPDNPDDPTGKKNPA